MECLKKYWKSNSNFASTFVDHHLLKGINFNGHCVINNISIGKNIFTCLFIVLNTVSLSSMFNKFV